MPSRGWLGWRRLGVALVLASPAASARAQTIAELRAMSITQLGEIQVSSVSKTAQPLSDAPGAIYVITRQEILASGATTLPEILRLAPNLEVQQSSTSHYVITARGMSGDPTAQSFSNKMLVLIDGRSVYTPLFSGVYWDMQEVVPADIERIEVISGPGATLWGANAVNGVVNIITRSAADTQGALVDVQAGALEQDANARYGGTLGSNLRYRLFFQAHADAESRTVAGGGAHDDWTRYGGGFRADWTPGVRDSVSIAGSGYSGDESELGAPHELITGRDLTATWNHQADTGAALKLQTYYDRTERFTEQGGGRFTLDTYDIDLQHNLPLGHSQELVWGGGVRVSHYDITGSTGPSTLYFVPNRRTLLLANLFAQDIVTLTPALSLTLGLKAENDPYAGVSLLPDLRLSWKPAARAMLWAAISRAVRSPTPFDEDVREDLGPIHYITGNPDFRTEKLTAFELGARLQPADRLSFSVSGFYNRYQDLRDIQITPGGRLGFLPLTWGNALEGDSYGMEAWADLRVASWWRLAPGLSLLAEDFRFKPGAPPHLLGTEQLGDDPSHQLFLRSTMTLPRHITLDADFRAISALSNPRVPTYAELNGSLSWPLSPRVRLSVTGFNLLHDRHLETPGGYEIPRKLLAGIRWGF